MEIKLYDSYNNELNLGDIILIRVPNKDIVYLGVLEFVAGHENTFRLNNLKGNWYQYYTSCAVSIHKIGNIETRPELKPDLGVYLKRQHTKFLLKKLGQEY